MAAPEDDAAREAAFDILPRRGGAGGGGGGGDQDEEGDEGWRTFARDRVLMGVEPSAEVAAIMVVYFVQGARCCCGAVAFCLPLFPSSPPQLLDRWCSERLAVVLVSGMCHALHPLRAVARPIARSPSARPCTQTCVHTHRARRRSARGALGLARLATTFLLKDELGLGPAEVSGDATSATEPFVEPPTEPARGRGRWGNRRGRRGAPPAALQGHRQTQKCVAEPLAEAARGLGPAELGEEGGGQMAGGGCDCG